MTDFLKIVLAGAIGAVLVLVGAALMPHTTGLGVAANVTTIGNPFKFTSTVTIGTSGNTLSGVLRGNCALATTTGQTSFTIAATTTAAFDCPATGVLTTDTNIYIMSATSTLATGGGFEVEAVSASTTAGYIRVHIRNNTGASGVLPASVASSTPYMVFR